MHSTLILKLLSDKGATLYLLPEPSAYLLDKLQFQQRKSGHYSGRKAIKLSELFAALATRMENKLSQGFAQST